MKSEAAAFTVRLERRDAPGTATFFRVPVDVMKTFAPRKRVPVTVGINGHRWRSTIAPYGNEYFVPVRSEIRARIGAAAGDLVQVELCRDDAPRRVDVSPDLQAALDEAKAAEAFAALSFTHQNEFVRWIEEAKRPETRRVRIAKTVERVKLKRPLS